jgi:hypothetical protein
MRELHTDSELRGVLENSRVIAVLGAHPETARPAFYVPDYLRKHGARVIPVNPAFVGRSLWGEPFRGLLREVAEPVDVVDVFRRPEVLPTHLEDILAMSPRPRLVWLQSGIRNDAVADALKAAGIEVVQDRCMLAEHRRLEIGEIGNLLA